MKNILYTFTICFLFMSCETEIKTDYVNLKIPETLKNEEAIAQLKKDEEQLNRALNNLDAMFESFTDLLEEVASIEEDDNIILTKIKVEKINKQIEWEATKGLANVGYFLLHEQIDAQGGFPEFYEYLSEKEQIEFTKCFKHLQVQQEKLEQLFQKHSKKMEALSEKLEAKKEMLHRKFGVSKEE